MKDMDLLVCSDLHGSDDAKKVLMNALDDDPFDAVVICGDFTTDGSTKYVREVLESVSPPLLAVPGNCDTVAVASLLDEMKSSVHSRRVTLGGAKFFGFGGAPPSPYGMPFEVEETVIASKLRGAAVRGGIMVTHTPAYGMNDLDRMVSIWAPEQSSRSQRSFARDSPCLDTSTSPGAPRSERGRCSSILEPQRTGISPR